MFVGTRSDRWKKTQCRQNIHKLSAHCIAAGMWPHVALSIGSVVARMNATFIPGWAFSVSCGLHLHRSNYDSDIAVHAVALAVRLGANTPFTIYFMNTKNVIESAFLFRVVFLPHWEILDLI